MALLGIPQARFLLSLALMALSIAGASAAPTVVGYELVSNVISGRTTVDYTYRIKVENTTPARRNVNASVASSTAATVIIDGSVSIGDLPESSAVTSVDTFTMRHNRLTPFDANALVWTINGSIVVPNVVGLTQVAATTAITNAGLVLGNVTTQNSANVPAGSVISQNPAANASASPNSAVDLVVSLGAANVTVPNVVGLTQAAATTAITNAGLVVGNVTTQNSANVPAGSVISQNPAANASVAPGSSVSLVVSIGPANVTVPNVVGLTQAAATTAITNAGLVVGNVTQQNSANVPAGNVISQNPAANASAAPNSAVDLVVSLGAANVTVPNVVGLTQAAATTAITNAGLVVGNVTTQNSANVPAGNVISQNPAANASVAPGSAVDLVVSLGAANVTVPNVVGLTQAAATTAITNAGLVLGNVTTQNSANVPAGSVISQNPAANASVAPGSSVNLVVSLGAANVTVPNVVGLTQAAATTAITNAGLVLGNVTTQNSANVPAGNVISQNPAANASVAPGSAVDLVVSLGAANVTVPNVVGLTQAAATTAITSAGLAVGTVTQQNSANVPAGNVISQNPAANASVAPGSAVDLVVSIGPANVTVPNVVGLTQAAATTAITNAGLVVGNVVTQNSANVPAGNVISQNPAANASVAPGSSVDLVVSIGPAAGGSVSQDVGPAGGTLNLGSDVSLTIPAGALNSSVRITVREIPLPAGAILPPSSVLASKVYSLEPDGQTFAQPVRFTIATDPGLLPAGAELADALIVRLLANNQFSIVQSAGVDPEPESHLQEIDPAAGKVSVHLLHFSSYSAIYASSTNDFIGVAESVAGVPGSQIVIRRSTAAAGGTEFRTTKPTSHNCASGTSTVALPSRAAADIRAILLHSTNGGPNHTFNGELAWGTDGCNLFFAHYYVDRDGQIYQVADDLSEVNHSAPGTYTNGNAIGIEMINNLGEPYDGAQVNAVIRLVDYLTLRYNLPRPQRDATTGLLTRDPATDRIVSHNENIASKCPATAAKCDPIGNFQSSATRTFVVTVLVPPQQENIPNGAAAAPSLIDMVVDALSVMQRDRNHTGIITTAGGDSMGQAFGGTGGFVQVVDSEPVPAYPGAARANHNQLVVAPGTTLALPLPQPAANDFSDVIIAGRLEIGQSTRFNVSGSLYVAPNGSIVMRDGTNGGNLTLAVRGPAVLQGLIDARGEDAPVTAATQAGGDGGNVVILINHDHNFLLPSIITRGGDTDAALFGGDGGAVTVGMSSGQLFVGGGTGPRLNLADIPHPPSRADFAVNDPDFTANFSAANSIFPSHSGDKLPPPAPFNLGTIGYPRPVANQRTPLQKSAAQEGFSRGILTSGGMGGAGVSGVNRGAGGDGGFGGNISIDATGALGVTFRDVDLITGGDVETTVSSIFVDANSGLQLSYRAPSGSLGGKAPAVSGIANRGGDGGKGGTAGDIAFQGILDPAVSFFTLKSRIIGYTNPALAPLKPAATDDPLDTARFSIGVSKLSSGTAGQPLYRLRLDDQNKALGGSGGIPGGQSQAGNNPGNFGALGTGGTITGLPH